MPFVYVLVRDQNLVVRGKNYHLICFVFLISFKKKVLKIRKRPNGEK